MSKVLQRTRKSKNDRNASTAPGGRPPTAVMPRYAMNGIKRAGRYCGYAVKRDGLRAV